MRDPATRVRPADPSATPFSPDYEYRILSLPRGTGRAEARQLLTEQAEYGRWELARTLLFAGGERKVWLRRKIIRVRSTLAETAD